MEKRAAVYHIETPILHLRPHFPLRSALEHVCDYESGFQGPTVQEKS